MWLFRVTNYLLTHRQAALALVVVAAFLGLFLPFFGLLAIAIALLMTLIRGAKEGLIFTLAASFPYLLGFMAKQQAAVSPVIVWVGAGAAILTNILSYIFALMLVRRISFSQLLQIAALMGVLIVSVVHLIYPDVSEWWGEVLRSYYTQALKTFHLLNQGDSAQSSALEAINARKQYATGFMLAMLLANAMFQLIVARWWQAKIFAPGSLGRELHHIRLNTLAGMLFLLGLVFSYLGNSVVLDIMPIPGVLFGVAGLSLVHYAFSLTYSSTRWFWLAIFYITLIISVPVSVVFVIMFALLDIWLDIRSKLKKTG